MRTGPQVKDFSRNDILSIVTCQSHRRAHIAAGYTAVVQQHGEWWIGWIEEVPGVNSQGQTREELLDNLRDALEEALEPRNSGDRS